MTIEEVREKMILSKEVVLNYISNRANISINSEIDILYDKVMLKEWKKYQNEIVYGIIIGKKRIYDQDRFNLFQKVEKHRLKRRMFV